MNVYQNLCKLYYKYIDKSTVNHYRLLLITEEYIKIGRDYFRKYPNIQHFNNLHQQMFNINSNAQREFEEGVRNQKKLKNTFFQKRKELCNQPNIISKDCIVCSEYFTLFYIDKSYHFEQFTDGVKRVIIEDINTKNL